MNATFPETDRDSRWCGLLCDLVAARPGLPAVDYLDGLVIAGRPNRYLTLFHGDDRARFRELSPTLGLAPDPVPWFDMLRLLTLLEALTQGDTYFGELDQGWRFEERRRLFPPVDGELIRLIDKAAERVRELRCSAGGGGGGD